MAYSKSSVVRQLGDRELEKADARMDGFEKYKFMIYTVLDIKPAIVNGEDLLAMMPPWIGWAKVSEPGDLKIDGKTYIVRLSERKID